MLGKGTAYMVTLFCAAAQVACAAAARELCRFSPIVLVLGSPCMWHIHNQPSIRLPCAACCCCHHCPGMLTNSGSMLVGAAPLYITKVMHRCVSLWLPLQLCWLQRAVWVRWRQCILLHVATLAPQESYGDEQSPMKRVLFPLCNIKPAINPSSHGLHYAASSVILLAGPK